MTHSKSALILAPDWPGENEGYQIALRSSLDLYMKKYERIYYFVFSPNSRPRNHVNLPACCFEQFKIPTANLSSRFLRSLYSGAPAVCTNYNGVQLRARFSEFLKSLFADNKECDVIYEDIPVGILFEMIKPYRGAKRHIMRSHNVLSEAFEGFRGEGNIINRLAWSYEVSRIKNFEENVLKKMDAVYAITERDMQCYSKRFPDIHCDYQHVSFSHEFFCKRQPIEKLHRSCRILSLGSYDLRKSHGMNWFVKSCYIPVFRKHDQSLSLVLGGRHTACYTDSEAKINGLGFIEDEQEFMNQGNIFVNPQIYGSGVKLKSLVAMAYGKCLISTTKGVEGIPGIPDEHFLVADSTGKMIQILNNILSGKVDVVGVGKKAREFIQEKYLSDTVVNRIAG